MKGKAEAVLYTPGGEEPEGVQLGEDADGVGFPEFKPWCYGMNLKNLVLNFPEGQIVEDNKKK